VCVADAVCRLVDESGAVLMPGRPTPVSFAPLEPSSRARWLAELVLIFTAIISPLAPVLLRCFDEPFTETRSLLTYPPPGSRDPSSRKLPGRCSKSIRFGWWLANTPSRSSVVTGLNFFNRRHGRLRARKLDFSGASASSSTHHFSFFGFAFRWGRSLIAAFLIVRSLGKIQRHPESR